VEVGLDADTLDNQIVGYPVPKLVLEYRNRILIDSIVLFMLYIQYRHFRDLIS
jgi:hypothetical protein